MIREIVRPSEPNLVINIPSEYVGQEIEYIVFPLHKNPEKTTINADEVDALGGVLNRYADPSKRELEDRAWEQHIMDTYSK